MENGVRKILGKRGRTQVSGKTPVRTSEWRGGKSQGQERCMERDDQGVDRARWGKVADPSRRCYVLKKSIFFIPICQAKYPKKTRLESPKPLCSVLCYCC